MKEPRVLVTGAGGAGARAICSGLRGEIVGTNCDPNVLMRHEFGPRYCIPHARELGAWGHVIGDICAEEKIDVIIPTNDSEVDACGMLRELEMFPKTFLPSQKAIAVCQDTEQFYETDAPTPWFCPLESENDISKVFSGVESLFIRLRKGSGSRGALKVLSWYDTMAWIGLWERREGKLISDFLLCEFLPGRDMNVTLIWREGELMFRGALERLSYFLGDTGEGWHSSTPALTVSIDEKDAYDASEKACCAVEPLPHGVWNLDLKQDSEERWKVTEINIGRFPMILPHLLHAGENLVELYLSCATEVPWPVRELQPFNSNTFMIRDLDGVPTFFTKEAQDDAIIEA